MKVRVSPARDRRGPARLTTTGRLTSPADLTAGACRGGRVLVHVKALRRTISARRVTIDKHCRFRSKVTLADRTRFRHASFLRVFVRFEETPLLARRTAGPFRVWVR